MNTQVIRNIWAIGRNYQKHAEELGNQVPDRPMIFLKAGSCIQASHDQVIFAEWLQDIHYELEVALQLDKDLQVSRAGLAIDFTERVWQSELKQKAHPWTLAKSFSGACAITELVDISSLQDLEGVNFELRLNGDLRQAGNTKDMIFKIPTIVNYVKQYFPVCPGDLILTGTPEGVGSVKNGDRLEVSSSFGVKHQWTIHQPVMRPKER